ncbi:MAG: orotate phosphoribosyltransferase, partial [Deltaproteobacteria bacterium]|nr:orotate phosphoribosyltransferase [Deltaproteobacteria bacterium]
VEKTLGIPIHSIVTITEIKNYLHNKKINGRIVLDDRMLARIDAYLKEYGAS